ncbi:MAG: hypothetical protein J5525_13055 [Lachnospiraceae bacterium]|nr:hypothetical protein [Lachnospiraceae bacterium]
MNPLIEEFFKITGRPISTMTVDEYIKLNEAYMSSNRVCTPLNTALNTEHESKPKGNSPSERITQPKNNFPEPAKKAEVKNNVKPIQSKTGPKQDKQAIALQMMRSVEG